MKHPSILALLCFLLFFSCRKNNSPRPKNETPFKASFKIYEPFYGSSVAYSTDTVITYRAAFDTDEEY